MADLAEESWQNRFREGLQFLKNKAPELAALQLRLALELAPQETSLHTYLLQSMLLSGQSIEALEHIQTRLHHLHITPDLHYWCGMIMENLGRLQEAQQYYLLALRISSQYAPAHLQMARLYFEQKFPSQALISYRKYLLLQPKDWDASLELAELLSENKQYDDANTLYQDIYLNQPQRTDVLLKWIQNQVFLNPSQIIHMLIELAIQHPHLKSTLALHAASILKATGEVSEARESLNVALEDPALPDYKAYALWKEFLFCPIADSQQSIQKHAQNLIAALDAALAQQAQQRLSQSVIYADYSNLKPYLQLWEGPGFLPYLNIDPRPYREKFSQYFQKLLPELTKISKPAATTSPRIVIVINSNTAVQAFLLGVLYYWPRTTTNITIAYTQPAHFKPQISRFRPDFEHIELSEDLSKALKQMQHLQADLIFYTELQTDRHLQNLLGSYRLAPVQVSSWLSSGTSGLNTVDYFISSKLLEQNENPERFYSERLILLEHLPASISSPLYPEIAPKRSEYGLPEQGHIYLCPHLMFKLHPDFDLVLEEILERDPEGHIVLLTRPNIPSLQNLLLQRFEAAFPDLMARIWFMPLMEHQDFMGLFQQADVILDPFYFGGGTTSFEALGLGVPVITWPGERLHGRITYAYYQIMNIFDCVAYNPKEYINLALQFATQTNKNKNIRQRILKQAHLLFNRKEDIQALAACLLGLASSDR